MHRRLAALVVLGVLSGWSVGSSDVMAQSSRAKQETDSSVFLLHLNFERLQETETGQLLIQAFRGIPFVQEQLSGLPDELQFLTEIQISTMTVSTDFPNGREVPVIHARARCDREKLRGLVQHGRGYAQVGYRGVAIHHWLANLQWPGHRPVADLAACPDRAPVYEPVFFANPAPYEFLISTSLANLNEAIDRMLDHQTIVDTKRLPHPDQNDRNLISLEFQSSRDRFPGNLRSMVREDESGRIVIQSVIQCRHPQDRLLATMINGAIHDQEQAPQLVNQFLSCSLDPENDTATSETALVVGDSRPPDFSHNHAPRLDLNFDSRSLVDGDRQATVLEFVTSCLASNFQNDELNIRAVFYAGPCTVEYVPGDGVAEDAESLRALRFAVNIYSSAEQRDAALQTADLRNDWFCDPQNLSPIRNR